jgi:hypothetical protein
MDPGACYAVSPYSRVGEVAEMYGALVCELALTFRSACEKEPGWRSRCSNQATGSTTGESVFDFQQGEIVLSRHSTLARRLNEPPFEWLPGFLDPEAKRPER